MNWLTNFIRPKIRSFVQPKDMPDNLWQKCPACEGMLFHRDLKEHFNVCYHCGHHMALSASERLAMMFDDGEYREVPLPRVPEDPLKFRDRKKYIDRLKESRGKTGRRDAIIIARGAMGGLPVVVAVFDFAFMGGSMGAAVGEGLVAASEAAVKDKAALIAIPSSGGARMQEGMVSLMQMPRSIIAVNRVKEAGLPYVVLLTEPTTGGVTASFAMVGDIHIAEPGCTIGFAGKRVIQETIREELPDGFQTAEYLLAHGMVDMVVPRSGQRDTLIRFFDLSMNRVKDGSSRKNGNGKTGNGKGQDKGSSKNGKSSRAEKAVRTVLKGRKKPANLNADKKQATGT
jgi:acetyl-CoA carboxylase carboxyl transferase subunit beta